MIQGIYNNQRNDIIYIVLTTPVNAIGGSAVCAFAMSDIIDTFNGHFKAQETPNSNWLPVPEEKLPAPRPGKCVDDSRTLPSSTVNFLRTHSLMDEAVPSFQNHPIFVRASLQWRLTSIVVDPQVPALDGKKYDVIFVGTDDGRVLKIINHRAPDSNAVETVVTSDIQVLPHGTRVTDLRLSPTTNQIVVVGNGRIVTVPMYHCKQMKLCRQCLGHQDPYCVWDDTNRECVSVYDTQNKQKNIFVQELSGKNIGGTCSKYEDVENRIEPEPSVIQKTHRGVLSAVGRSANDIPPIPSDSIEISNNIGHFHLDGRFCIDETHAWHPIN